MYKIREVTFIDHPILKNLKLNFCGSDGKAVDTIIFAGENGTGKSRIIDTLFRFSSGNGPSRHVRPWGRPTTPSIWNTSMPSPFQIHSPFSLFDCGDASVTVTRR